MNKIRNKKNKIRNKKLKNKANTDKDQLKELLKVIMHKLSNAITFLYISKN